MPYNDPIAAETVSVILLKSAIIYVQDMPQQPVRSSDLSSIRKDQPQTIFSIQSNKVYISAAKEHINIKREREQRHFELYKITLWETFCMPMTLTSLRSAYAIYMLGGQDISSQSPRTSRKRRQPNGRFRDSLSSILQDQLSFPYFQYWMQTSFSSFDGVQLFASLLKEDAE